MGAEESAGNGVPDNADIDDSDNSSGAEDGVWRTLHLNIIFESPTLTENSIQCYRHLVVYCLHYVH